MAASTYEEALRRLLAHEGGYGNHPDDPGGPTNYGITLADYAAFKGRPLTAVEVRAMPLADAKAIYRANYWARLRCDALPAGLDYAVFDYGVNSGTARAARVLQRLCGVPDDGIIGPATLAALREREASDLIAALCDERLAFLKRLKTWPVFGRGWERRVREVRAAALAMAQAATSIAAAPPVSAPGKGAVPLNRAAQRGSAGGVAAGGASAAGEAHTLGAEPLVVAAILIAAFAAAVAVWAFWLWRQRRLQQAIAIGAIPPSTQHGE